MWRKAAKYDGVHGAEASAREHCDHGLGYHRHVDQHPVALRDALGRERPRKKRDFGSKLPIGIGAPRVRDRAIVDECRLVAALVDVPVEGVVASVELRSAEPPIKRGVGVVEDPVPSSDPVDSFGHLAPEAFGVFEGAAPHFESCRHDFFSGAAEYSCASSKASVIDAARAPWGLTSGLS